MTIGKSQFLCHLSDLRNQSSFEHAILCLAIVCSACSVLLLST